MKSFSISFRKALRQPYPLIAIFFIVASAAFSQQERNPLETHIYKLENGLTIYLNEDPSLPSIIGAVAVKGGSKRDPAGATGIAHYFEHIMFKGTDSIGTLDYRAEKVFLDSIAVLYDELAIASSEEEKAGIQLQINRLSVKAAEFAIPNEFDKILGEMGGTMVNAMTSNEEIVYFNIFPSNQVEKWLRVYSHRFITPVYRLFQSELETVYEEYNMYKDDRFSNAFEEFERAIFPGHPYGVPILGYPEHLKTPSMKKMDEYFRTYYVANNMALILSGNFSTEEVKPLIEQYFGVWRTGEIPTFPAEYKIEPFKGRTEFQKKMTPVKFGAIAYRSVPIGHKDEPVLDVLNGIFSNPSSTGLMDKLGIDNKLMQAGAFSMHYMEAGTEMVLFVPKIVGQSLKKAEKLVFAQIDSLKAGKFSDDLLEAVKTQIIVNYERNFEDQRSRGYVMVMAFVKERDWQEIIGYPEVIRRITREDVISIASEYYGDDYLVCYSKTGFPKKPETLKPPFEPVPSLNTNEKSVFAQEIENMPVLETDPDFIEFGPPGVETNEVTIHDINPLTHLYHTENKVNELFNLTIGFGIGTYEMPVLEQLAEYMVLIGTESKSLDELSGGLQRLGAGYYFSASKGYFNIFITGPDMYLDTIMALVTDLLYNPEPDDGKIKNLTESVKANQKFEQGDPETVGTALYSHAIYGNRSQFVNRLTLKEVRDLKADALLNALKQVIIYEADIHYSGTVGLTDLEKILTSRLQLDNIRIASNSPVRNDFIEYNEPVVFFLDDRKAIQSKNYFFIQGDIVKEEDKPYLNAYAEYLSGGMHSIVFQEIREFRSLAYATGAYFQHPFYPDEKSGLTAYVGTQADKTREAVEVMYNILTGKPDKSDRIDLVRKSMIQSIDSDKPGFRSLSYAVAKYHKQNYREDPRKRWMEAYREMNFDDIAAIYESQYYSKPTIVTVIGDEKKIGTEWMKDYGRIIKVKKEEIFRW